MTQTKQEKARVTRRNFLKGSAAVSAAAVASQLSVPGAYAGGTDTMRVGLIGCGGRGTGAAQNCMDSAKGVELVAMGDLFEDRLNGSRNRLKKHDACKVTDDKCFVGFDAYKKVLNAGVDMVILATPPHFRPQQYEAAIKAGKHVFMEKPVAVDPVGIRSIIKSSELAAEKGLSVVAGTQRRHHAGYQAIMDRIHDGALGEVVAAQCYWNMGFLWVKEKKDEWSEMEWQVRNWLYFTWLSGDHITEQHVHNLDVVNWAFDATPTKCMGMGGRQVRTGKKHGNIFDHFAIEYVYPNGARVLSMARQIGGCSSRVSERIVGTKGTSNARSNIQGENSFSFKGKVTNPYVQEHADLIKSIRNGEPVNEGKRVAESTLTAIMGRMSAYTGKEVSWDWVMNQSKLQLGPDKYEFGDVEANPVATPGKTSLM